jgi:hypothetical protein
MSEMEDREITALKHMVAVMEHELSVYRHVANNIYANKQYLKEIYREVFESKYTEGMVEKKYSLIE